MEETVLQVRARKQRTNYTCGPASLRSIFYYYEHSVSEQELVDAGEVEEDGTDFSTMRKIAHEYGYSFFSKHHGNIDQLRKWLEKKIPVLVCYQEGEPNGKNGHYAVIHGINEHYLYIADPSNYFEGDNGKFTCPRKVTIEKFLKHWWEIDKNKKIKRWYAIVRPKQK